MSQKAYAYGTIADNHLSAFIIYTGMLVRIGSILEKARKSPIYGIVIECDNVGLGIMEYDKWKVFSDGQILTVSDNQIWPLEFFE